MSLQADYIKEREGIETLEFDYGFITYRMFTGECYIIDLYVRPEFRKSGLASDMAKEVEAVCKKQNIHMLIGSVDTRLESSTDSAKVLLAYGFKILRNDNAMIYFQKEIT